MSSSPSQARCSTELTEDLTKVFIPVGKAGIPALPHQRAMDAAFRLFNGHGKGADMVGAKGTAFGLLNAVTQYVDHERQAKSADHRLDSAWFGAGATLKRTAAKLALELIA